MKGVVFDLFGTLCGRTYPEEMIIERFGLNAKIRETLEKAVCGYRFDSWKGYLENISRVTGVQDKKGIKEIIIACGERGKESIHPKAKKVLEELHGSYKIGLVSSTDTSTEKIIERLPDVFSAITLSYKVGLTKHTPEIFKLHLKELGVKEACMVGDNLIGYPYVQKSRVWERRTHRKGERRLGDGF
jgi:FMN phosphatase YigB (HAD superfamily)